MTDTSKTDTTKTDTVGYINRSTSYVYDGNLDHEYNSISSSVSRVKHSNISVNPIKDLTLKLKLNIYLMDAQTPKVQEILLEYEARTYQSTGDNEELNEAAHSAQNDIAEILTIRQKKEWESSKNEWWASVNKALNLSYLSKNRNDY